MGASCSTWPISLKRVKGSTYEGGGGASSLVDILDQYVYLILETGDNRVQDMDQQPQLHSGGIRLLASHSFCL